MNAAHIETLSQEVVNRIAAGEVVQRPCAALKELLENSIDAGATQIQVFCGDGGLGVMQITDDGVGIFKEDLPLLCERFATSKIRSYDDLWSIDSFGFRGEALASISHVAKVSVITYRRDDKNAWRCRFLDGKMVEGPLVCAGNFGTIIRVEDLFYNAPVRKSSLGRPSEEYGKVIDVIQKYSVAFPHISFSCRSTGAGGGSVGVNPSNGSVKYDFTSQRDSTTLSNLKVIFGVSFASHLHKISETIDLTSERPTGEGAASSIMAAHIEGFVSDATLVNKKSCSILFINNRLVDSTAIRKCMDQVYASVLVGGNRHFSALMIRIPSSRVDVNVHPTKHEVLLLDEELILKRLSESCRRIVAITSAAKQLHVGQVNYEAINLKPVSSSSTNVSVLGHKGVVVAPCTMTRVTEQRGDLLKYVSKVDPFALVEVDVARRRGLVSGSKHRTVAEVNVDEQDDFAREHVAKSNEVFLVDVDSQGSQSNDDKEPRGNTAVTITQLADMSRSSSTKVPSAPPPLSERLDQLQPVQLESNATSGEASVAAVVRSIMLLDSDDDSDDNPQREFQLSKTVAQQSRGSNDNDAPTKPRDIVMPPSESMQCHCMLENAIPSPPPPPPPSSSLRESIPSAAAAASIATAEPVQLTSVECILQRLQEQSTLESCAMFKKMVFVGNVDHSMFFAQSGTSLLMVNTLKLAKHVAFQRAFTNFGRHAQLMFTEGTAPDVRKLLHFAVMNDMSVEQRSAMFHSDRSRMPFPTKGFKRNRDGDAKAEPPEHSHTSETVDAVVDRALKCLKRWRGMLSEYFGVELLSEKRGNSDGTIGRVLRLSRLPLLLGDTWPVPHRVIPMALWKLANNVDFTNEELCFTQVATILADELFGKRMPTDAEQENVRGKEGRSSALHDAVRFGLLPLAANNSKFFPPMELFSEGTLRSVVTVETLYKVFERC